MLREYAESLQAHITPLLENIGTSSAHQEQGKPTTIEWMQSVSSETFARRVSFQHGLIALQFREAVAGEVYRSGHGTTATDSYRFSAYCGWKKLPSPIEAFTRNEQVRGAIVSHEFNGVTAQHDKTISIAELSDCCVALYEFQFSIQLNYYTELSEPEPPLFLKSVVQQAEDRLQLSTQETD